jgi:hypothetical protein
VTYTGYSGGYLAINLLPGSYRVKVSAVSFLPSLIENVVVRSGSKAIINVTLNTLSEAIRFLPARQTSPQDEDDWKWTLRSAANRPILRLVNDGGLVVSSSAAREKTSIHQMSGRVAFVAGSQADGFGGASDYGTSFNVRQGLFASDTLSLDGLVGNGNGQPAGVVRACFKHQLANGDTPTFAVTLRHTAPSGMGVSSALSSIAWTASNTTSLGGLVDLSYGSEFQDVEFMRHISGVRPFASAAVHAGKKTVVRYSYATAEPSSTFNRALDNTDDPGVPAPRLSVVALAPVLEKDRHQEVSVSRDEGDTKIQAGVFFDRVSNLALTGVGDVSSIPSDVIPDFSSDTFTFNGGGLDTRGVRVLVQHKFAPELTALLDYAFGGAVAAPNWNSTASWEDLRDRLHVKDAHSVTAKLNGLIPMTGTRWVTSYKWVSSSAVTPVDMFNSSPGQADPYLSVVIRQKLPGASFLPGHVEALVDIRNLLAQGYRPFLSPDGRTLYLVQSARAVRGGLAFTF